MTPEVSDKHRRSIRLREYDYTKPAAYFVTVCAHDNRCIFGKIVESAVVLSKYGQVVQDEWLATAEIRPNVTLDAFVVMPNHFHGIITLTDEADNPLRDQDSPMAVAGTLRTQSLGAIVSQFKSVVTKRISAMRGGIKTLVWQRNYHEHIIRNEADLASIREYIINNPGKWMEDRENPDVFRTP